jgi:dTDP-4-dehydrorhamnose 3,5-epimerase
MLFSETKLKGSFIIDLKPFSDGRRWFVRTFCKKEFEQIGHSAEWVQLNHSGTNDKGTVRGLHFQYPPYSKIKLVRCITGAVYDVIIDLGSDSPTFLQWIGEELSGCKKRLTHLTDLHMVFKL